MTFLCLSNAVSSAAFPAFFHSGALTEHEEREGRWRSLGWLVIQDHGLTRVMVRGQPYMRWRSGDEECVRLAIVQLYECGFSCAASKASRRWRSATSPSHTASKNAGRFAADFSSASANSASSDVGFMAVYLFTFHFLLCLRCVNFRPRRRALEV
jgi:hypothetical protein